MYDIICKTIRCFPHGLTNQFSASDYFSFSGISDTLMPSAISLCSTLFCSAFFFFNPHSIERCFLLFRLGELSIQQHREKISVKTLFSGAVLGDCYVFYSILKIPHFVKTMRKNATIVKQVVCVFCAYGKASKKTPSRSRTASTACQKVSQPLAFDNKFRKKSIKGDIQPLMDFLNSIAFLVHISEYGSISRGLS